MRRIYPIALLMISAPLLAQSPKPAPSPQARPQSADRPVQAQGPQGAPSDPWDIVPATVPYRNVAASVKSTAKPGQPSPLNPSCEGKSGAACVREEQAAAR